MTKQNIFSSLLALIVIAATCLLTACTQPAKPEVDIGDKPSKIGKWDWEKKERVTISSVDVAHGKRTAPVNVIRTYGHETKENMEIYRVTTRSKADAEYVDSQKKFMIWVDNYLFSFATPYQIDRSESRPRVNIEKPENTAGFYELSNTRHFTVGSVSYDGLALSVQMNRQLSRQTTFVEEICTESISTIAEYVKRQGSWMFYIGDQLYQVNQNRRVEALDSKPPVDLGIRHDRLSGEDYEIKRNREVIATSWSLDRTRLLVDVKQHFEHDMRFETEVYVVERKLEAYYSNHYEGWVVEVEGDTYLFDIDGCRSKDAARDAKLKFAPVPDQLRNTVTKSSCSPKPTPKPDPKPEEPTEKQEVNAGRQTEKIYNFDKETMDRRKVTPLEQKDKDKEANTWPVSVTRHYVNIGKTTLTKYYIQKNEDAKYDASKRGYVLEVGKDTYVISKSGKVRKED